MRLLLCLFWTSVLLAQSGAAPDAARLLIRSGEAVLMADTVLLAGKESFEIPQPGAPQIGENNFSIQRASGGRLRIEGKLSGTDLLVVSDGTTTWMYTASTKTYTKTPADNRATADGFGRLKFARDPALFHDAKIVGEESLEFHGEPAPCYVVRAAYSTMPSNPLALDVVRTVWIRKSDEMILRDKWEFSTKLPGQETPGKGHLTTDYTQIASGMPLADDLFVFLPPTGSTLVTQVPQQAPVARPNQTPVRQVQPEYTAAARAAGIQGTISLYVEIAADGHPVTVEVMQGLGLGLDEKAVEAVIQWEFTATPSRSQGAEGREIQVQFRLDPPGVWQVAGEVYWYTESNGRHAVERVPPTPSHYAAPDSAACPSTGDVAVELLVTKDGNPREVRATRGSGGAMANAAVKAVESWRFQPASENGKPVEAHGEVQFQCQGIAAEESARPVYRIGGQVTPPSLTFKVEPEYSEQARQAKLQGQVRLAVLISPDGSVSGMRVVRSLGLGLDRKAMEAIKRWRFTPGMKGSQPVTVEATVEVNFQLL